MDQISLFNEKVEPDLEIIESKDKQLVMKDKHKIYRTEFINTEYLSTKDIFRGFDEIRAITFSYDLVFMEEIMEMFEYGELVLGGRFMVRNDGALHKLRAEALQATEAFTLSETTINSIKRRKKLVEMMSEGNLYIKSPKHTVDHRKLYLLKADDGRTRVIKGSANLTGHGFSGNQNEYYEIDDTRAAYDAYLQDFETAWRLSEEISEEVVIAEKTGDPEVDNPYIKKAKETQEAILLEKPRKDKYYLEHVRYAVDVKNTAEKNADLITGVNYSANRGYIEIRPNEIKKIKSNYRSQKRKKMDIKEVIETYPKLTIDYTSNEAYIDKEKLNLNPSAEEVKNDIDVLFEALGNYEKDFIGRTDRAVDNHYKLLNILFSSPFNARIRCRADLRNIPTSSLPLFVLMSSPGSNTGKTFMAELILKYMTGKSIRGHSIKQLPTKDIEYAQSNNVGTPIFIDEIDGPYFSRLRANIKNSNRCEKLQIEEQPLIVLAQNQQKDPSEPERKRMPFLKYDINLKSEIDESAYEALGKALKNRASDALYREYLRRMIVEVGKIDEYITTSDNIPDDYYPDLINVSSIVLMEIFKDFGYELPGYVRELTWNNDLSYRANHMIKDAVSEIREMWGHKPRQFEIKKDIVIINLGTDANSRRIVESWENTLPAELEAYATIGRDKSDITMNRKELEKRLGFKLSRLGRLLR